MALCHRHANGGRPSISVWCSHVGAPENGNEDRTRCQRRTTLSLKHSGKNCQNPLLGRVCLLTTGVLISVGPGLAPHNALDMLRHSVGEAAPLNRIHKTCKIRAAPPAMSGSY